VPLTDMTKPPAPEVPGASRTKQEVSRNQANENPDLPRTPIRSQNTAGGAGSRHLSHLDAVPPAVVTMGLRGAGLVL